MLLLLLLLQLRHIRIIAPLDITHVVRYLYTPKHRHSCVTDTQAGVLFIELREDQAIRVQVRCLLHFSAAHEPTRKVGCKGRNRYRSCQMTQVCCGSHGQREQIQALRTRVQVITLARYQSTNTNQYISTNTNTNQIQSYHSKIIRSIGHDWHLRSSVRNVGCMHGGGGGVIGCGCIVTDWLGQIGQRVANDTLCR
jgi:hypothetical protein